MSETPTTAKEVKIRGSLMRERALGSIGLKAAEPTEPNLTLSGSLIRESRIKERIAYLEGLQELVGEGGWQRLLSGDNKDVSVGGVQINPRKSIHLAGAEKDPEINSFGGSIKGEASQAELERKFPTKRYKFYHSIKDKEMGEKYLAAVISRAVKSGIPLTFKTFDHAYDGVNVYTFHFQEMAAIIEETYPLYKSAFYETEHFLQGPMPNVDPQHIGWVQEPVAAAGAHSHSGRMGVVGEVIDRSGLSTLSYRTGCEKAGVRPDMPWLLTEEYERELQQRVASKSHS